MKKAIKRYFQKLILAEGSSHRLALSFCVGAFIAISPVIPLQTPLIFLTSWLFSLDFGVNFAAVYLINNPLSIVPIYVMDYFFGYWLFEKVLNLNLMQYNPSWVDAFNRFLSKYVDLAKYTGSVFCFWCLMLGGFLLAFLISLALYPLMLRFFQRVKKQVKKNYEADSKE